VNRFSTVISASVGSL